MADADYTLYRNCTKCGQEKPATTEYFRKQERGLYGLRSQCKVCEAAYNKAQKKAFYHANAESERAKVAAYRAANPDKVKETRKKNYEANKDHLLAKRAAYYAKNREKIAEQRRVKYAANIENERRIQRERRAADPERMRQRDREYRQANLERIRANERVTGLNKFYKRYKKDIGFTLKVRTSALVRASLKAGVKSKRTEELLGYSTDELKAHLEAQFTKGMSWQAFMEGQIHIDHIIPVSSFNIISETCDEFRRCWSLSNIRPLWAKDNLAKGAKVLTLL